jgi:hypothetical protein
VIPNANAKNRVEPGDPGCGHGSKRSRVPIPVAIAVDPARFEPLIMGPEPAQNRVSSGFDPFFCHIGATDLP